MADRRPLAPPLFAGFRHYWPNLFLFGFILICYWFLVFISLYLSREMLPAYQILSRSFALTGATLIGWSLLSSLVFKWFPQTARFWSYRRALGVSGFLFATGHAFVVYWQYYAWDLSTIYFSLNPFVNPIVFGTLAFPIFLVMTMTATDWAVARLGGQTWKNLQRLVYLAYLLLVFHFLLIVPDLTTRWPGVILVLTTMAVLLGQLYWWWRISASKGFRSGGTLVGLVIVGLYLVIGYLAFSGR